MNTPKKWLAVGALTALGLGSAVVIPALASEDTGPSTAVVDTVNDQTPAGETSAPNADSPASANSAASAVSANTAASPASANSPASPASANSAASAD